MQVHIILNGYRVRYVILLNKNIDGKHWKSGVIYFFPSGWLENVYTSFMSCVCTCVCVYVCARACPSARLQLNYVAMAIFRKRSQFMIK